MPNDQTPKRHKRWLPWNSTGAYHTSPCSLRVVAKWRLRRAMMRWPQLWLGIGPVCIPTPRKTPKGNVNHQLLHITQLLRDHEMVEQSTTRVLQHTYAAATDAMAQNATNLRSLPARPVATASASSARTAFNRVTSSNRNWEPGTANHTNMAFDAAVAWTNTNNDVGATPTRMRPTTTPRAPWAKSASM